MTDTIRAAYAYLHSPRSDQPATREDAQIALSIRWLYRGRRRPYDDDDDNLIPLADYMHDPSVLLRPLNGYEVFLASRHGLPKPNTITLPDDGRNDHETPWLWL